MVRLFQKSLFWLERGFSSIAQKKVGIIGVPFDKGQPKSGVNFGPQFIREDGKLIETLRSVNENIDIRDYGDVIYQPIGAKNDQDKLKNLSYVAGCTKSLSEKVKEVLADGRICLTLGGDHSIGIGTVSGHLGFDKDTAVVWVDAHADINLTTTTPTGNMHGMPLGFLVHELQTRYDPVAEMDWCRAQLQANRLFYIGLRDLDAGERRFINELGISSYGMREIDELGIQGVMREVVEKIKERGCRHIHCSFDIDSLDELEAPSTGTRVRGGLTLREGLYVMEELRKTNLLKGIDLVEVNPKIGSEEDVRKTVKAAVEVIATGIGENRIKFKH